ncbi:caspase family protein [Marinobacter sp. CHS3-4]|uniref:caspase family protein n=1 Tax=Marinobacter sp. CHS3-4 TaxID=3045174 RepID=UPI0024B4E708|nr:caspase family protein [Marinobacter sp. CHS3-4]MDI9245960.1 caspase family protein [Marinobacter sp. CHS3-4]
MDTLKKYRTLFFVGLAMGFTSVAAAKNHALLIGVGDYPAQPLEGPKYDVAALKTVLMDKWNFAESEVQVLLDEEASKNRILSSIDALYARTEPGDNVFIYFSGHGTSAQDYEIRAPLPTTSGAFIPYDIAGVTSRQELVEKLVVGRDDLRPRFEQFDSNGRHLFVAIDACYSGNTVRGAFRKEPLPTRHLSLNQLVPRSFGADLDTSEETTWEDEGGDEVVYPYKNVFYLGASGEHEKAQDIPERMIEEYDTFDNNPHGAFTDTLLRFMSSPEAADVNKDGSVNYAELRQSLQSLMQRRGFNHTPQGLPAVKQDDDRLAQRSVFLFDNPAQPAQEEPAQQEPAPQSAEDTTTQQVAVAQPEPTPAPTEAPTQASSAAAPEPAVEKPAPQASGFKVYVDPALNIDESDLAGLSGVQFVSDRYDVGFMAGNAQTGASGGLHVVDRGGELVRSLSQVDAGAIEQQIVYERWLQKLLSETRDSARGMGIEAGFSDLARGSAAVAGELIGLDVRLPDGGYLMILNYTSDGTVNVIYPFTDAEAKRVASQSKISFTDLMQVTEPYGRDVVHFVVLNDPHETYQSLVGNAQFAYDSSMGTRLRELLAGSTMSKGVTDLTLLTARQP